MTETQRRAYEIFYQNNTDGVAILACDILQFLAEQDCIEGQLSSLGTTDMLSLLGNLSEFLETKV